MRYKQIILRLVMLSLLWQGLIAQADVGNQVHAVVRAANLRQTKFSLSAMDIQTGQTLIQIHANEPMVPASNMKLLTTAAALDHLGPDFMFKTSLEIIPSSDQAGTSLLIRGDGDPSLGDPILLEEHGMVVDQLLDRWVDAVQKANLPHVDQLIVDDRIFDRQWVHPSWPKDQLNRWYCAQVAGLNFHNNCLDIYPSPTRLGDAPLLRVSPPAPFLRLSNRAVTGKSDSFWVSRQLGTNELVFRGKVKHARIKPVSVALDNPPLFFAQLLRERLSARGITVNQIYQPQQADIFPPGQSILLVQTTLPVILARCNKDSQNLFAEALLKRMGHQVTGSPGSWDTGRAAMRLFLHKHLGTRSAGIQIDDGSGMSRKNKVSAKAMTDLLTAIYRDPRLGQTYFQSLSIGGQDGTLRKRFSSKTFKGTVHGKSGYIRGVSTLSGYLVNANGRAIAFSFLFNDFKAPIYVHQIKALQDKLVSLLDKEAARLDPVHLGG